MHRLLSRLSVGAATSPANSFTQALDHFDATNTQTFQQRYVIDSTYAKGASSPVVYYICGEGDCINDELGPPGSEWAWGLAQALGAHIVALEHRYYGQSQPFAQQTAANFTWLTVEQAIEDLATFQKWAVSTQGLSGKWVAIGGSYPADLAAIYRLKHPELVSGAIASSACAQFSNGTDDSDRVAAQTAGASCTQAFRAQVLTPIVNALGNETAMAPIKAAFDAADIPDDLDFLGTVTGMAIFAIQETGAQEFCAALQGSDPLTSFATFMKSSVATWGTRLVYWSYAGMGSTDATQFEGAIGMRQWMYQGCTEEGQFSAVVMMANPDTTASLSSALTNSLPGKYCAQYFNQNSIPPIDQMNAEYYQPLLDPTKASNILFVSGSNDPACFPYSISKENGNDTNPDTTTFTVQGGSHCEDLEPPQASDSASLQQARSLEVQLATQWTSN